MPKAPNRARLQASHRVGQSGVVLDFEMVEPSQLGFSGGKYVIFNTGQPVDPSEIGGKTIKRAYSILSKDIDQGSFRIAVQRIDTGAGSKLMAELEVGRVYEMSGPWGKWQLPEDARDGRYRPALVVATDTGITAAMGLVMGQAFDARRGQTVVHWMRADPEAFLPEGFVRESLTGVAELEISTIAAVGTRARRDEVLAAADELAEHVSPREVFMVGDGAALAELRMGLSRGGFQPSQMRFETFFNREILFPD